MSKIDQLKKLRKNDRYKEALASARSDVEKKMIQDIVEQFVISLNTALEPLIERAKNDPEFAAKLEQSLKQENVVLNDEPLTTGSIK